MATFYRLPTVATQTEDRLQRVAASIGRGVRAAVKRLQYAQMVSALNRLPDRYLREAGLLRSDIPEHARRLIYGDH